MDDKPLGQAVIVVVLYGSGAAAVMYANELLRPVEVPWTWLWVFWTVLFAPAIVATLLAAAWTSPPWPRLKILYGGAVLFTLSAMELACLADLHLPVTALVVFGVSAINIAAFRAFHSPA